MKKRLRMILIIASISTLSPVARADRPCVESAGLDMMENGEFGMALDRLAACETLKSASGQALVALARLYSMEKYAGLDRKENLLKIWSLLHEAATRGSYEAVQSLVIFYRNGEPDLNVAANPGLSECLAELSPDRRVAEQDVARCFLEW